MSKTKWNLDLSHSEVTFKVKHMMITNVSGSFKEFSLDASSEGEDFSSPEAVFRAKAASVFTNADQRDTHLRSAEFFDSEKYPDLIFKTRSFKKTDGDNYELQGDLTIRDVTKNISLTAELGGIQKDPWGQTKAGMTVSGKINRKDFGLNWNAALEAGGVMVSDEVRINCEIQMIKAA
ncbi:MAG: YceI family protein [bacterium]|nr:YceI family protein [bacterium]